MDTVKDFSLKALHVFQVRTLRSLGFDTRVTLSNKSHNKGDLATDYRIDLTVYSPDGLVCFYTEGIAELQTDSVVKLDCAKWLTHLNEDQVMVFHLIPRRLLPFVSSTGGVDLDRSEIWSLFTAQDHYVEYYQPDGFSSGVLYQSGAFNYRKFSREETTVIQAPKVFLSPTLDTILSILHTSFEPKYDRDAVLNCVLLDESGKTAAFWTNRIKPYTGALISIREMLQAEGNIEFDGASMRRYTLLGLCENAALLPLIMNFDASHGALAVEHSLPPLYYGHSVTGPIRAQMISDLRESGLFQRMDAQK